MGLQLWWPRRLTRLSSSLSTRRLGAGTPHPALRPQPAHGLSHLRMLRGGLKGIPSPAKYLEVLSEQAPLAPLPQGGSRVLLADGLECGLRARVPRAPPPSQRLQLSL